MREYPETQKGSELFFWFSGFVAAIDGISTARHEQIMDGVSTLICDVESEVRREERERESDRQAARLCKQPNKYSTQGLTETCILEKRHPGPHYHYLNGGTVWQDAVEAGPLGGEKALGSH